MQVTEAVNEGLKRELNITVPVDELETRLMTRLIELKDQVRIDGFRPGKVPMNHLRKVYGQRLMAEIIQQTVQETSQKVLDDRKERPAVQPEIAFSDDKEDVEKVMAGKGDLVYTIEFEVIPDFEPMDFKTLKLVKPIAVVSDEEVNQSIEQIAAEQRDFVPRETKPAKAQMGDRVTIDFEGFVDGEPFEGGAAKDTPLELGSNSFIPGFEDQLIDTKPGDDIDVKLSFPEEYGVAALAGKEALFKVKVKAVEEPINVPIDDTLAERLGVGTLETLRDTVKEQISGHFEEASAAKLKRALLDGLDEAHEFGLPEKLLEQELEQIMSQVKKDMEQANKTFEDDGTTEEKSRAEFKPIAERRVRLGLLMGEVGDKNKISVSDDEVNNALMEESRKYQGQEKQVIEYYQKNPEGLASLRAPLFEQKVVDFMLELAEVTEKTVTREELFANPEEEETAAKLKKAAQKSTRDKGDKKPARKKPATKKPAAKEKPAAKKKD